MTLEYKTREEMELLDKFAMAALPALLGRFTFTQMQCAEMAYVYAQEMVKARHRVLTTPPLKNVA